MKPDKTDGGSNRRLVLLPLFAMLAFGLLGAQVAVAGHGGGGAETASHGKKHSKSSKVQLRKLRRALQAQVAAQQAQGAELKALRGQVAALQAGAGAPATPTGAAGGDLTGSYPDPNLADGSIDSTDLFSAGLLDGAAGTPSLRTLGTGANQALPGDATPGGPPTGSAGGGLTGTYPNPTIADGAVHASSLFTTVVRTADGVSVDDSSSSATANCSPGERLLSGGSSLDIVLADDVVITYDGPSTPTSWFVRVVNRPGGSGTADFHAYALCLLP